MGVSMWEREWKGEARRTFSALIMPIMRSPRISNDDCGTRVAQTHKPYPSISPRSKSASHRVGIRSAEIHYSRAGIVLMSMVIHGP